MTLVVLCLIGSVASAGIAMGRGEMGWMMGGSNGMMGGDSGCQGDAPKGGTPEQRVKAVDFSFSPSTTRIPRDETVNIAFHNAGEE